MDDLISPDAMQRFRQLADVDQVVQLLGTPTFINPKNFDSQNYYKITNDFLYSITLKRRDYIIALKKHIALIPSASSASSVRAADAADGHA